MWAPRGIQSSVYLATFSSIRAAAQNETFSSNDTGTEITKSVKPIFPLDLPSSNDPLNNLSPCKDSLINVCGIVTSVYLLDCLHSRRLNYAKASNLTADPVA